MSSLVRLRSRGVEVVVDLSTGAPLIVYWGADLGDGVSLHSLAAVHDRPLVPGSGDVVAPITVVPEHGSAFPGRPGLTGRRRGGGDWSPRFSPDTHELEGNELRVAALDEHAELRLEVTMSLDHALVVSATLTNFGDQRYLLDGLSITLPLPEHAGELHTVSGRWSREFQLERRVLDGGTFLAENRRGRTSHEHPPMLFASSAGAGEWQGEVWGAHLAWSGNHGLFAERLPDGRRYLQLAELLHPGEVVLESGESYSTPEVIAVCSAGGFTPATQQYHRHLRARPEHPVSARPVLLNTWEAVYFDHDLDRLRNLATAAASVGIERFVLDDGWFGSRRNDRSGLGDWVVSAEMYPEGLNPLIQHVTGLGMEFGIWVEPEMVNPDSDLFRAHPEWALVDHRYEPVQFRHQLVLDLGNPDAYAHVLGQLDALLRDHDIAYVKWDMNRDHTQAAGATGSAGTRAQTLALYRLLDELNAAHPTIEIESCSSGGARVDHEILRRTRRVWTSDCNDALERQQIQRGASMLIPPELMGAHIGPTRSHTTGRVHSLAFRAATAMFGHLGVEWDVLSITDAERAELAEAIALHRRFRPLLHGGDTVRFDTEDPYLAHGVYAPDRSEALVSWVQLRTAGSLTPPPLRLPGLDPDRRYQVTHVRLPGERWGAARRHSAWLADGESLEMTGTALALIGLRPPVLHPESAVLFHLA